MFNVAEYIKFFSIFFVFVAFYYGFSFLGGDSFYIFCVIFILVAAVSFMFDVGIGIALCFYVALMVTQPFFTLLISSGLDEAGIKLLVASKEIALIVLFLFLLKSPAGGAFPRIVLLDYIVFLFIFTFVFSFMHGGASMFAKVLSLREGVFIGLCYFIGRLSFCDVRSVFLFCHFVCVVAAFISAFGLVERFFFSLSFWGDLGALDYSILKRGYSVRSFLSGFVPDQWFSYYFGEFYRRMVSVVLDPTSLSRFLAFPLIYLVVRVFFSGFHLRTFGLLLMGLISSAMVLSFGKGGFLVFICALAVVVWGRNKFISIVLMLVIFVLVLVTGFLEGNSGNFVRHTSHYSVAFSELAGQPLGSGLGLSGQQTVNYGLIEEEDGGEESFFISFIRQCGLLGLLSFILFFCVAPFLLLRRFFRVRSFIERDAGVLVISIVGCYVGVSVSSFLANSAVSMISASVVFILIGSVPKMLEVRR